MRTAVHSTPNVLGMILRAPRGRVDRSGATRAVSLRTIQQSPGMRSRPRLPQGPAVVQCVGNGFTNISVRVFGHGLHFIRGASPHVCIIAFLSSGGAHGTLARPNSMSRRTPMVQEPLPSSALRVGLALRSTSAGAGIGGVGVWWSPVPQWSSRGGVRQRKINATYIAV